MTSDHPQLPVFYVNLAARPDRRAFMEAQFARLGIKAERFEAIPMADVPAEILRGNPKRRVRQIAAGDLACGLSHQGIWKLMTERRLPAALILEDDAQLSRDLLPFLDPGIINRLPGFDLIKVETRRDDVLLGRPLARVGSAALHELQSSHMGGAGYIISLKAAERSLAHPGINDEYVDRFLFGRRGPHLLRSRILQAVPSPIVQLDHQFPGRSRSTLPDHARSDLIRSRAPRGAFKSAAGLANVLRYNADHLCRLLLLFARDPHVLVRRRLRVAFADELGPTE